MNTTPTTAVTVGTYTVDPAHSSVGFAVRHLGFSKVRGKFDSFQGTVTVDPADVSTLAASATIEAASINTGDEKRDAHLRSEDFFAADEHPTLTFESTGVRDAAGETLTLVLSVHAEKPVSDFVFGLGLFAADGTSVYGTNTDIEDYTPRRLHGDAEVRLSLEDLRLVEGTYLVDLAAHKKDGTPYDYLRGLHSFRVKSRVKDVGLYRPRHHWSWSGGAELDPPAARADRVGEP